MPKTSNTELLRRLMDMDLQLTKGGLKEAKFHRKWGITKRTLDRDLAAFSELGQAMFEDRKGLLRYRRRVRPIFTSTREAVTEEVRRRWEDPANPPPVRRASVLTRWLEMDTELAAGRLHIATFGKKWHVSSKTVYRDLKEAFPALGYPTMWDWGWYPGEQAEHWWGYSEPGTRMFLHTKLKPPEQ